MKLRETEKQRHRETKRQRKKGKKYENSPLGPCRIQQFAVASPGRESCLLFVSD